MLKILRRVGVASAAAALLVGGVGVAHASMAPTTSFQFCGTAYTAAPFVAVGPLPGTATPLSGKMVTGHLYDALGSPAATYSAVTDVNGGYCLSGNSTTFSHLLAGGRLELHMPGSTSTGWSSPGITWADLPAHRYMAAASYWQFYIVG